MFFLFYPISTSFLYDLFSNDSLRSSGLTDPTKYGMSVRDIDPSLDNILTNDWVIFGKITCPFTLKAMVLLKHEQQDYIFVNKEAEMKNVYEKLKTNLNHKTIPLIVREGKFFGGYTQLLDFFGKKDDEVSEMEKMSPEDNKANDYYTKMMEELKKRSQELDRLLQ